MIVLGWEWKGEEVEACFFRPLLTFYRVFQLTIPRELKFPRREGESKFFRRCWGRGSGGVRRF